MEVTLDEWLQLAASQKVADQAGMTMTWSRHESGGLIIAMGKSNVETMNGHGELVTRAAS